MKKNSKRYKELLKNSKDFKSTELKEILELIKKNSTTKFDESIDVSLRIGLKQSKGGDFNLRTVTQLPSGTGKKLKVAVLCEPDKTEEAKNSGAEIVGSDDLIEKIASGKFDFDRLICTPGMMSKIGKHGKVLGPKGLMPNPKLGTVSTNIKKSVTEIKSGLIEVKHDKDGNIGTSIGRKSFSTDSLIGNLKHLVDFIKKEKPDAIKGEFIKNIYVTSSMGVSLKVSNKSI
jgi:large subunit ribosomal protein L1|tara:strand:+ start:33 stop:725 length:693 start_codon:yes stop_codon:yes gene_type:complete